MRTRVEVIAVRCVGGAVGRVWGSCRKALDGDEMDMRRISIELRKSIGFLDTNWIWVYNQDRCWNECNASPSRIEHEIEHHLPSHFVSLRAITLYKIK